MHEREQNTPFTNNFIYLIMLTNELENVNKNIGIFPNVCYRYRYNPENS